MDRARRTLATPAGPLELRPESAADAPFLLRLHGEDVLDMLRPSGLPEAALQNLVEMQHRAKSGAYAANFPRARADIVEIGGEAAGRLMVDEEPGRLHVVDIALLRACQGRGFGAALIGAVVQEADARNLAVRAEVLATNTASLAMFARHGFRREGAPGDAYVAVRRDAARS